MVIKEYARFCSPHHYKVAFLLASCFSNGACSKYLEKWTGCSTQPWVLVWICFASPCLIKIIPILKYEHSPRQAAKLDKMWSTCTPVSKPLQWKPRILHEWKLRSWSSPWCRAAHSTGPTSVTFWSGASTVCAEAGSGKKQERRRPQTMRSVPRQRWHFIQTIGRGFSLFVSSLPFFLSLYSLFPPLPIFRGSSCTFVPSHQITVAVVDSFDLCPPPLFAVLSS